MFLSRNPTGPIFKGAKITKNSFCVEKTANRKSAFLLLESVFYRIRRMMTINGASSKVNKKSKRYTNENPGVEKPINIPRTVLYRRPEKARIAPAIIRYVEAIH